MNRWETLIQEKENEGQPFAQTLFETGAVGGTSSLSGDSQRYENYRQVFGEPLLMKITEKGATHTQEDYEEDLFKALFLEILKRKNFEDCGLSYTQVVFESKREEIESLISGLFSSLAQVSKVFSFVYNDEALHFQILTSNVKYDRDLMMHLLSLEYEIGHSYRGIDLSFDFIPRIYESESEVVVDDARLIYHKEEKVKRYEFITRSSSASESQQTTWERYIPLQVAI